MAQLSGLGQDFVQAVRKYLANAARGAGRSQPLPSPAPRGDAEVIARGPKDKRLEPDYQTLIVGAGFSGICAAIALDAADMGDYVIVEAGQSVGGTWYWNTYPGIAVDIPSFAYQFSFEQRPDWSRTYAPGNELKGYADTCADKYGIRQKIRFNTKVLAVEFDDERALWRVQTDPGGEISARFLVNAS